MWWGVNEAGWSVQWGRGPLVHSHDQLPFRLPWCCVGKGPGSVGDSVCVCFHFCLTALLGFSHRTKPFEKQSPVYIPTGLCPGRGVGACLSASEKNPGRLRSNSLGESWLLMSLHWLTSWVYEAASGTFY